MACWSRAWTLRASPSPTTFSRKASGLPYLDTRSCRRSSSLLSRISVCFLGTWLTTVTTYRSGFGISSREVRTEKDSHSNRTSYWFHTLTVTQQEWESSSPPAHSVPHPDPHVSSARTGSRPRNWFPFVILRACLGWRSILSKERSNERRKLLRYGGLTGQLSIRPEEAYSRDKAMLGTGSHSYA